MPKPLTKNQKEKIISLYKNGTSPKEIGERFGIYNNSVIRILRKNGIERNQSTKRITEEQTKIIIAQYSSGVSSETIATNLEINGSTVCRTLKRNGIAIRSATENKRKYWLNESWLDNIDTEEKAYFLGLMLSDGNVHSKTSEIKISLKEEDIEILKKLSNILYNKDRIKTYLYKNGNRYSQISLYSPHLKKQLGKYGCLPAKTFNIKYPTINPIYNRHLIRGLIDGDGGIYNYNSSLVSLTGTKEILDSISKIVFKELKIETYRDKRHKDKDDNIEYIYVKKNNDIKKLLDWIYVDSNIFINRKYQSYKTFLKKYDEFSENYYTNEEINLIINDKLHVNSGTASKIKHRQIIIPAEKPTLYGTTYIPSYKNILLTKENILPLSLNKRKNIALFLFEYFRTFGFPYPTYSNNELNDNFNKLKSFDTKTILKDNIIYTNSQIGHNIFKHFCNNFFSVKNSKGKSSMFDTFNNDDCLMHVIENRLGINYSETFTISGNMMRQGLRNSRKAFSASIFKPTIAKLLYDMYAPQNGTVFDFSFGFGQRMLGALSSSKNLKYIGCDPWKNTYDNVTKMMNLLDNDDRATLLNIGSENVDLPNNSIDFAMSSPPYYNIEMYSDDSTQANCKSYSYFIKWWEVTINNIYKSLKPNGIFALNMNSEILKDMSKIILNSGFTKNNDLFIQSRRSHLNKNMKLEPIAVFKK